MTIFFNKEKKLSLEDMHTLANSYQKTSLADVVSEVKLGQEKKRIGDGSIMRVYRVTLEFEDAKILKNKLGINFSQLKKVFSETFVPRLMHETL